MPVPMDSPRTTIALGPLEISLRRREDGVRLGVLLSLVVHVLIMALLLVATHEHRIAIAEEAAVKPVVSIPITFANPLPPLAPPPKPKPKVDEIASRTPPPPASLKPLRMQPVPESTSVAKNTNKDRVADSAGRHDTTPAGGEQGGEKPEPTAGVPKPSSEAAASVDESKDIFGRLREFKQAVEAPKPAAPHGPEGGGHGSGGVTMPNLPATGFGIGNLEFEGRDYDWENYGRQIHGIIWRAWHNRLLITASVFERWAAEHRTWLLDHRNGVRFTILRTGQVVDVAIETPSGCYPLDDSATDALREVVLPPLPPDFQRDQETVHARFIAEGEIRAMKPFLQQMKNAGFF
jgi:outer membrane biosynthesis protein TonB